MENLHEKMVDDLNQELINLKSDFFKKESEIKDKIKKIMAFKSL